MCNRKLITVFALAAGVQVLTSPLYAQQPAGTTITYQGRLSSGGEPLNGVADLRFELWDAATFGTQLGVVNLGLTPVADGLFTVQLDFGAQAFSGGSARWLQVIVDGTPLAPRQLLTAVPYALTVAAPLALSGSASGGPPPESAIISGINTSGGLGAAGVYGANVAEDGSGFGGQFDCTSPMGRGPLCPALRDDGAGLCGRVSYV